MSYSVQTVLFYEMHSSRNLDRALFEKENLVIYSNITCKTFLFLRNTYGAF